MRLLYPENNISRHSTRRGLAMLTYDGMLAQLMGVLTGGAFLVAYALLIGASNVVIGMLAAIGPFTQILQIPSIFIVEKIRMRKFLTVTSALMARALWIVIAILPWFISPELRIPLFLISVFLYFALSALTACAWNSWMRDFIPEKVMGRYFARRMALATAIGAIASMLAGVGIDFYKTRWNEIDGYSILFLIGTLFGIISILYISRVPEPMMTPVKSKEGVLTVLKRPFKDHNFRRLLVFLASWNFSVNLAAPFFVVYMLKRLGLTMTWVMGLALLSQIMNVIFFRLWGRLADRFTNKSVLAGSGPIFMLCTMLWVFTTMPERHFLTIPLLMVIHALTGISTAGINIAAGNIALKAAPKGEATAYLATNALVSGIAATISPILGGIAADLFANRNLSIALRYWEPGITDFQLPTVSLGGLDFVFLMSFLVGFYSLRRLALVREEGEVEEEVVMNQFYGEVRRTIRHVSNVAGLRHLTSFPFGVLKDVLSRFQRKPEKRDRV